MRIAAVLIALLTLPASSVPAAAGDGARDVAKKIYKIVEKACPEDGDGVPYNLAEIAQAYFSPALNDAVRRAYERNAVGFDILIDAQDCAIDDLDIDMHDVGGNGDAKLARAEFRNFDERRDIELVIVRTGEGWKVEDVLYRHRDWSARRDLEGGPRRAGP